MKRFALPLALATALLGTAPAFAGGIGFDLPRLDFPAPQPAADWMVTGKRTLG